jgi:4'-phosphopantetheinyl transferase
MPQVIYKKYNNGVHLLVWEISENFEELKNALPENVFFEEELKELKHEAKVREFLASRLAIIRLMQLLGLEFKGLQKDEHGKPFLKDHDFQFSLTHSINYIGVVMHPTQALGVDIERPSLKIKRILPRLFTAQEIELINDDLKLMSIFWSAKEALYKLYGKRRVDFRQHLRIFNDPATNEFRGEILMPDHQKTHQLMIEEIENYLLVIAL